MDVSHALHAARGEVYDQRSGPGRPCRGLEWWVIQLGRTRLVDEGEVYPGYGTLTHGYCQGPTHVYSQIYMPECA